MLLIKVLDAVVNFMSECIYCLAYVVLVVVKWLNENKNVIVICIVLGCIILGGLFGYCWRVQQIYGY